MRALPAAISRVSFRQYIWNVSAAAFDSARLEVAKSLLADPDLALSEIALRSGFSDQAAFSRTFGSFIGNSAGTVAQRIYLS